MATAEALFREALALHRQGRLAEAAARYEQALQMAPTLAGALNNLAACRLALGQSQAAIALLQQAVALHPDFAAAHLGLAQALNDVGSLGEAADAFARALALLPDQADAWSTYAALLTRLGRLDAAENACRRALALRPDHAEALSNLGNVEKELGRFQQAAATQRRALALKPASPEIGWNFALAALTAGDYAAGWPYFACRLDCAGALRRSYDRPRWDGRSPLQGKRIFLYPELGFGDTINFVQFAPLLKQRGAAQVTVECQPPLLGLLGRMAGIDLVIPSGAAAPAFDCHLPLIDLLPALAIRPDRVPRRERYLTPPANAPAPLVQAFAAVAPGRRKIGLVWAGDASRSFDRHRSLAATDLLALGAGSAHAFFSLQKVKRPGDDAALAQYAEVVDLAPHLGDFDDAAWAVDRLDLLITVDTAAAHLAGALGKPVWNLLRFASDWRYPVTMGDSPWYASMRLFRQPSRQGWDATLAAVAAALRAF
ncbi:MAG TPA: tetratricopeptide repeat protein [Candidatus Sulfotelmatobacter sp.]|nr:tetratricopeptide repeat protein [Candidatus Sulfotelmatobacter sp.]